MPITWDAQPVVIDIPADVVGQAIAESIATGARERIPQGQLSDGSGSQAAPRQAVRRAQRKGLGSQHLIAADQDGIRGYDNGNLLAKRIKAVRLTGGKSKAEYAATLQLNPGKVADRVYRWLERELAEGVEYIHAPKPGSPGAKALDEACERVVEAGTGGVAGNTSREARQRQSGKLR